MGVLNLTPDSFSDGGRFLDVDAAVEEACIPVATAAGVRAVETPRLSAICAEIYPHAFEFSC